MNRHSFDDNDQAARIAYLIAGYIRHSLSETEHDELDAWVEESDNNMQLFEELTDEKNIEANLAWMDNIRTRERLQEIKKGLAFQKPDKRIKRIFPVAIAAGIFALAVAVYLLNRTNNTITPPVQAAEIFPAPSGVTLTLSNGKVIRLDSNHTAITAENNMQIPEDRSGIDYAPAGLQEQNIFHRLSTGLAGKFNLRLGDGTVVWLNATSSIRYPATFSGQERVVELSGEAYFEVAKDPSRPFKVKFADSAQVTVLGTHFNIQSYPEESKHDVTLFEGKVDVTSTGKHMVLQPGQQCSLVSGKLSLSDNIDEEEVLGWKNDNFIFHDADIATIMRQLSRWYNIRVTYEHTPKHLFNAAISRKEPLSKLLHLLELTGKVHFKTENNQVYVL